MFEQQTGLAVQPFPVPTPMMLRGEQSKPRRPVRSPRTMPRRPERMLAVDEELYQDGSVRLFAQRLPGNELTETVELQH